MYFGAMFSDWTNPERIVSDDPQIEPNPNIVSHPLKNFLKYHAPALAYAALIVMVSSIEKLAAPEIDWLSTD